MRKLSMQELIKKLDKFELENPEVDFRVQRSSTKGTLAVVHIYEDAHAEDQDTDKEKELKEASGYYKGDYVDGIWVWN